MPTTQPLNTRRDDLPLAGRTMELRGFTRADAGGDALAPLATAKLVFTSGAAVLRYDWFRDRSYMEVLVVEEGSIRMERLRRGAPLLNTHNSWDLEAQLGVVENPVIVQGEGECDATFSRRESVSGYVQDVADRIIRNVSVGYVRHKLEMVAPAQDGGMWTYRVTDWEPYEVSLVPIPADMDSQVRSAGATPDVAEAHQLRTFPCEFLETRANLESQPTVGITAATSTRKETSMSGTQGAGGTIAPAQTTPEPENEAQQRATQAAQAQATAAATQRAADITGLCVRHGMADQAAALISSTQTVDQVRATILDGLAARDADTGGQRNVRVETLRDETQTRMAGVQEAITHRVVPGTVLTDNGRQYRGMSLLEIGRGYLKAAGVETRGMDRMEVASRMLQHRSPGMYTSSDFASLFANVANKRLRNAYDENPGTYGRWARRAPNAPDFKNMSVVVLSGAPDLLKTNEHGEFKVGGMSDGAETYAVLTYGRIVPLSRQAIVNDDLRGFDRIVGAFGNAARRLENRTVYSQVTANAALADGVALFHASHNNLQTGAGSALQFSALAAGRTAMRLQKGLQSEELNIAPAYLIVPGALEQTAYQLTSSQYVPSAKAEVNEFRAGGRTALEPIIEPLLDANSATAWYLAAENGQIDTVEYCYLDGAEGPVIESEVGFEVDGINYKCRLDFAAKAVDFRGLNKAAGV